MCTRLVSLMVMATSKKAISFRQKLDIIASIEKGEEQKSVCQQLSLTKATVNDSELFPPL